MNCKLANIDTLQKAIVLFIYPTLADGEPDTDNGPLDQDTLEYTDDPVSYYCNRCGGRWDDWEKCVKHVEASK